MRLTGRTAGALVAAVALLLSGCGVVLTPETTSTEQQAGSPPEGSDGSERAAPGDLLPDSDTPGQRTGGDTTGQDTTGQDTAETGDSGDEPETAPEPTGDDGAETDLGGPGIPACDVLDLPATALDTIEDIEAGGPYEFPRNDGVTFQNREGILPDESHDYYREFTVVTPNLDHRGARRIVTGGSAETDPDHWYFTADHYESFCEFDPDQG